MIPDGGLDEETLLAIEDGPVDLDEEPPAPAPADGGIDGDAWHEEGEEEATLEDDVPLEPPAADPYLQKAESLLKLRSPQLDEHEDAQVAKATSAETLPETSPPAEVPALTRRSHVFPAITPKKLFAEEESAPPTGLSAAREQMRAQLRQIRVIQL